VQLAVEETAVADHLYDQGQYRVDVLVHGSFSPGLAEQIIADGRIALYLGPDRLRLKGHLCRWQLAQIVVDAHIAKQGAVIVADGLYACDRGALFRLTDVGIGKLEVRATVTDPLHIRPLGAIAAKMSVHSLAMCHIGGDLLTGCIHHIQILAVLKGFQGFGQDGFELLTVVQIGATKVPQGGEVRVQLV